MRIDYLIYKIKYISKNSYKKFQSTMQVCDQYTFLLNMTMEDRKFILPNVISDAQPIQCPIQLKTEIFTEAKFKAIREKNIFF